MRQSKTDTCSDVMHPLTVKSAAAAAAVSDDDDDRGAYSYGALNRDTGVVM